MSMIADLIKEGATDWKKGESEKADRNKLMMKLFSIFLTKQINVWLASAQAVLYLTQYLYKVR